MRDERIYRRTRDNSYTLEYISIRGGNVTQEASGGAVLGLECGPVEVGCAVE